MSTLTPDEEKLKRSIFDSMSPRMRKRVEKIGYEDWDPFPMPKEPPFMKGFDQKPGLPENPIELYHTYMKQLLQDKAEGEMKESYRQGVMEACKAVRMAEEWVRGVYEFYEWYCREKKRLEEPGSEG